MVLNTDSLAHGILISDKSKAISCQGMQHSWKSKNAYKVLIRKLQRKRSFDRLGEIGTAILKLMLVGTRLKTTDL
jgi:hypothetical protein